ncbi:MAG: valine--tRNA ligase [Bacteroidetes bacterium]|jgi:valyl-tRNA synthetase|nr:valine--tRNA ligase [Bacteroidota bacterium]
MSDLSTHYEPQKVEGKWYEHWEKAGYFHSEPDERPSYTVVIPPPNVTGVLHMGHMLNNTIQDILVRRARQEGKNTCWVPGTDHASIATEAKVVKWLREEKEISKGEIGREKFMEYAWQWTEKYGGVILQQLKKLGASCDWERSAFTLDEVRSKHVIQAFVDLYRKGKLYRDYRMVNWDPEAETVLSNEEVIYKEESSHLYHVRYKIVGSDETLTIATTRPETILADTAIAVHPEDERYMHLKGKRAIVPLVERPVPIIFDDYVDPEFGTGALKVTPAHDANDYALGKKYELEVINMLDEKARVTAEAGLLVGEDRFVARKMIRKLLDEAGHLIEVEDYINKVGRSERTNSVVEPRLSLQWYVDMGSLAQPALEAVESDEVEFFPKSQKNLYRHWMENIKDWCISRQLWWGHRIPAYYCRDEVFVAPTAEEALSEAQAHFGDPQLALTDLKQEEDVLDTWFSSWLWPISVFNGFADQKEIDYYYPTQTVVTGWDIIFLWIARMVMAGYEWKGERPFDKVYFTGMVRDKQGRKMSKSLGNSPDALKMIDEHGADAVRFGMLSCSPAGGDLLFDMKLVEQGRNFCNKMWNALKLTDMWEVDDRAPSDTQKLAVKWMQSRLAQMVHRMPGALAQFRLSDTLMQLYNFIWTDFCSWYLELVKPDYEEKMSRETYDATRQMYADIMILLHPFMPFVTEEIWSHLKPDASDCTVQELPELQTADTEVLSAMEEARGLVTKVREIRNDKGIGAREPLKLLVQSGKKHPLWSGPFSSLLQRMGQLGELGHADARPDQSVSFVSGTDTYYVPIGDFIDTEAEIEKLNKDLEYARGFLKSVEKKLSNERFVNNAPDQVVEKEKQKQRDGAERLAQIEAALKALEKG